MKSSNSSASRFFTMLAAVLTASALLIVSIYCAQAGPDNREPDVPADIRTPGSTNKVQFHAYAVGVQIYDWNGTNWVFRAPEAALFTNAGGNGKIGIHYAGPTWESERGSKVVGARIASAPSLNTNSIPQLLLKAVSVQGHGIFARTTYIQRVNTVGGVAPVAPGTFVGQEARMAYTAEYFFYGQRR